MPMLPSGRHVAILFQPLFDLLHDAINVVKVHKVLAIQHKKDVCPFVDVLWLVPEGEATEKQVENAFLDGSLPRPPGLIAVRSGFRLSQFDEYAANWSVEDRKEFWEFIRGRSDFLFDEAMAKSAAVQKILRSQAEGMTKLMVLWWDAGVHPAQEGYKVEEGELPIWDTYDMLSVLGQMLIFLNMMDLQDRLLDDRMRLQAALSLYAQLVPQLAGWPDLNQTPRGAAEVAREGKWLDAMDDGSRLTLHRQCVSECVALWDHLGERLPAIFPDCAKIIDLVVVSADANEVFDR
jgi:hypothetical protein